MVPKGTFIKAKHANQSEYTWCNISIAKKNIWATNEPKEEPIYSIYLIQINKIKESQFAHIT